MYAAVAIPFAAEREEPWGSATPANDPAGELHGRVVSSRGSHAAPAVDLSVVADHELLARVRGGEREADVCEAVLAESARMRAAIEVAIAEGLCALRKGDRLASLGYHLDDYGREVLDMCESGTRNLARLGAELRTRPLLREALRSGRVGRRAAEVVLPVAKGDAEANWVERAMRCTVRELEEAVRRLKGGEDPDEEWFRLSTHMPDESRAVLDVALDVARRIDAGPNRWDQLEAMAQEYLAEVGADAPDDTARVLREVCWRLRRGDARRATLEQETDRWAMLPPAREVPAPEVTFDDCMTADEIDATLRMLAADRAGWDGIIGWCAYVVRRSGMATTLGFGSFGHYAEERLQLASRTIETRERLEAQVQASPALREARRKKVSYEKLRILARLPEAQIRAWISRAKALTCIALRRQVDGDRERQMRSTQRFTISMPRRVAEVVATAVEAVRKRLGLGLVPAGRCLAIIGGHFSLTWKDSVPPVKTRSQKVRERDEGRCQVPSCSHAAAHSHHIEYRSHGGSDELANQIALCEFHHQRCVHGGYLRVTGEAPHKLTWWLRGKRWNGGAPLLTLCP